MRPLNCGHLFNGIGGFALAAHWMGWSNVMHCEIDPFCNKVMNYNFPNSFQHEDIRTTDFTIWRGKIDLITGGFPCQPYSTAGKRKGTADDRHLWPQMLRAVREVQPEWIVGENVRGLTNWNGGLVFDEVQSDLEAEGYEVLPFLLPACAVNAPHRRDRIWFVAHANNINGRTGAGRENRAQVGNSSEPVIADSGCIIGDRGEGDESTESFNNRQDDGREEKTDKSERLCETGDVTNPTIGRGLQVNWQGKPGQFDKTDWQQFPTQSPVCNRNDGFPSGLVDITFSKWRKESIKALGNAVVPQVVYQIFKAIEQWQLSQE